MGRRCGACYPRLKMHARLKSAVFVLPVLLLVACTSAVGSYFSPTAAVVNGRKIPEEMVSAELRRAVKNPEFAQLFRGPQGDQNRKDARREILTRLIKEEVIIDAASSMGVRASNEEIEQRVSGFRSNYPTEAAFKADLTREGITLEEIRVFLRKQILVEGVQRELTNDLKIGDDEIASVYEQKKADYEGQVRASHILICQQLDQATRQCTVGPGDEELARSLTVRARAGEDFGALTRQFSQDSSTAANAGDLGWFGKNAFVPAFEDAAFAMQPGQISDPVRTQFGLHVIRLVSKGRTLADAREEIQEQLARPRRQEAFGKWLQETTARARVRVNPEYGRYDQTSQTVVGAVNR